MSDDTQQARPHDEEPEPKPPAGQPDQRQTPAHQADDRAEEPVNPDG